MENTKQKSGSCLTFVCLKSYEWSEINSGPINNAVFVLRKLFLNRHIARNLQTLLSTPLCLPFSQAPCNDKADSLPLSLSLCLLYPPPSLSSIQRCAGRQPGLMNARDLNNHRPRTAACLPSVCLSAGGREGGQLGRPAQTADGAEERAEAASTMMRFYSDWRLCR